MKKFLCVGGWVEDLHSQHYSTRTYIPARKLADLYKVNPAQCVFMDPKDYEVEEILFQRVETIGVELKDLLVLRPDTMGVYKLPGREARDEKANKEEATEPSLRQGVHGLVERARSRVRRNELER